MCLLSIQLEYYAQDYMSPEDCGDPDDRFYCWLSCNQCTRVVENFCEPTLIATPDSLDECKAYGEEFCQRRINRQGQLPCSSCKSIERFCSHYSPRHQDWCLSKAKKYCQTLCKDCNGMAQIYCPYQSDGGNDECIAEGIKLCRKSL